MGYSLIHGTRNPFELSELTHTLFLEGMDEAREAEKSTEGVKSGCKSRESDCMIGKKDFNFEEVRNQYRRNFLESGLKNK